MVLKPLALAVFVYLFSSPLLAQQYPASFSLGSESYLLIGGETNASFDFLLGARGNYFFQKGGDLKPFASLAVATDIFNQDSRLITADAQIGLYWKRQRKLSLYASAGVNYGQESHRFLLNDGPQNWDATSWGVAGQMGLNLRLAKSIHYTFFVKQINLSTTALGMGINYAF